MCSGVGTDAADERGAKLFGVRRDCHGMAFPSVSAEWCYHTITCRRRERGCQNPASCGSKPPVSVELAQSGKNVAPQALCDIYGADATSSAVEENKQDEWSACVVM